MHDGGEHVWWLRRKAVFTFSVWLNPCWHSTAQGAQVETSNPPFPYKSDKNDFYALKVIKVYLYKPNIDLMTQKSHGYLGNIIARKNGFQSNCFRFCDFF